VHVLNSSIKGEVLDPRCRKCKKLRSYLASSFRDALSHEELVGLGDYYPHFLHAICHSQRALVILITSAVVPCEVVSQNCLPRRKLGIRKHGTDSINYPG
jgi:hypothetical protein